MITEKQQEALEAYEKHGGFKPAARALGISPAAFRKRIRQVKPELLGQRKNGEAKSTRGPVRSLADFMNEYDKDTIVPQKIDEALEKIGADGWVYESEFVKIAGVSFMDLGTYRDEYADHIVFIKRDSKRVWAGSAELARKMKEML